MAVVVQVGDIISARLNFRDILNSVAFNQLHYKVVSIMPTPPAVYTGETMTEVGPEFAKALHEYLGPAWQIFASQQVGFEGVTVQNIWPTPKSRQYTFTRNPAYPGNNNVDALPLQDAPTLVKRSPFGQRWGIGRVFVVGLDESQQNMGMLNADAVGVLNDWGALLDDPIAVPVNGVTFNFKPILVGTPPAPGAAPRQSDLVSVTLSGPSLKTQRRRRPGKGI